MYLTFKNKKNGIDFLFFNFTAADVVIHLSLYHLKWQSFENGSSYNQIFEMKTVHYTILNTE